MDLDKFYNWTLIGWRDAFDTLKVYFEDHKLNLNFISTDKVINDEKFYTNDNIIIASTFKRYSIKEMQKLIDIFSERISSQILRKKNPNIIYLSSSSVYGLSSSKDSFTENALENPYNEYAFEKLIFENLLVKLAEETQGKCIILRAAGFFGKYKLFGKSTNIIDILYESNLLQKKISLDIEYGGCQVRDFIHINDLFEILSLFAKNINKIQKKSNKEIFNVSNNKKYRIKDILNIVQSNNKNIQINYDNKLANKIHNSLDNKKLVNLLGKEEFIQIEDYI